MAKRKVVSVAAAAVAAIAIAGAAAWACTVSTSMIASVESAAPDTRVQVSGNAAALPENSTVDIRWGAIDGPKLASVVPDEGSFSVDVAVPQVPNGVSYLVATSGSNRLASLPFQVKDSAVPSAASTQALAAEPLSKPADDSGAPGQGWALALVIGGALTGMGVGTFALMRRTPAHH